jgi:hypothetical protein
LIKDIEYYNKTLIFKVKAIFDYKEFKKGELYEIDVDVYHINKRLCFDVIPENSSSKLYWLAQSLDEMINKFDLVDDVKEERRKKLQKLKKLHK